MSESESESGGLALLTLSPEVFRFELQTLETEFTSAFAQADSGNQFPEGVASNKEYLKSFVDENSSLETKIRNESALLRRYVKVTNEMIERYKKMLDEKKVALMKQKKTDTFSGDVFTEYKQIYTIQYTYCALLGLSMLYMVYRMWSISSNRTDTKPTTTTSDPGK